MIGRHVCDMQAAEGIPDASDTAMTEQEQAGFLQHLSKSGKAA